MKLNARQLDQFYTCPELAQSLTGHLWQKLSEEERGFSFLEPSAGKGAFLEAAQSWVSPTHLLGLDLDPKHPHIQSQDFLEWVAPHKNWVVFGNPPFGKNSSLAVKFFNHAASFAQVIGFIVPRTFEKQSLQKRLSLDFDLVEEVTIPPLSFFFEGQKITVPCVFQLWRKLPVGQKRILVHRPTTHPDFSFQDLPQGAAFAFQRVGVKAGRTKALTEKSIAPPSHYFLVPRPGLSGQVLRKRLDQINWDVIKFKTAGNPSIGRADLVEQYIKAYPSL